MPKRKRDGASVEGESQQLESLRTLQAKAKIHHGQNLLHRAFKTAKGFERQKLSRRRKTAVSQKDAKDISRIDAEIEAIKTLDTTKAATNYLAKSLLKIKAVSESPDRPSTLTIQPSQSSEPAVLNVIARLCNSNPVKEILPQILSDVERALGIERSDRTKIATARKSALAKGGKSSAAQADSDGESDDFAKFDEDEDEDDDNAASDADSADFAAFDARLASSSEDDDDDDNDEGKTAARQRGTFDARALLQAHGSGSSASESDEAPEDEYSEPDDDPVEPKKGTKKTKKPGSDGGGGRRSLSPSRSPSPPSARPTTSAFLPSLTMGGYISGSESADDLSDDAPKQKNRRGQRARRAIWEKKFGKEAKHVKDGPAPGSNEGRDQGWDAKRGATDGKRGRGEFGRGGGARGRGGGGGYGRTATAASNAKPEKHRDDDGPLHPSWIAAKKRKEEKEKMAAPFQGKKITFD